MDETFSAIARQRPGALFVLFDPVLMTERVRIVELANKNRLPGMYPHREYVEAGGLMAYGAILADLSRRAGWRYDS